MIQISFRTVTKVNGYRRSAVNFASAVWKNNMIDLDAAQRRRGFVLGVIKNAKINHLDYLASRGYLFDSCYGGGWFSMICIKCTFAL